MKRNFAGLCCCLLLLTSKAASAQQDTHSLLWRISGKDLSAASYLFGTIHLICPDDYLWTDAMKQAFSASKQACFEMDMDDPEVFKVIRSGMSLSGSGKQLQGYFSAGDWKRLSRFMKDSLGQDIAQLQGMKPMVLESILASGAVGCSFPNSYEANLVALAQSQEKEILGLESPEEQLRIMASIPDDSLSKFIMQTTDSFAQTRNDYAALLAAYKQQDLPKLYTLLQEARNSGGMDMRIFLDARNKKWIPKMELKMHKKSSFFAVGAGHLWGEAGVIALLRQAGYQVEPVR